jgi:hypothetical protein
MYIIFIRKVSKNKEKTLVVQIFMYAAENWMEAESSCRFQSQIFVCCRHQSHRTDYQYAGFVRRSIGSRGISCSVFITTQLLR